MWLNMHAICARSDAYGIFKADICLGVQNVLLKSSLHVGFTYNTGVVD